MSLNQNFLFEKLLLIFILIDIYNFSIEFHVGVSTCATFANAGLKPDAVMVLLADRGVHSQVSTTAANHDHLKNLLGLVHYTESLASAFDTDALKTSPVCWQCHNFIKFSPYSRRC